MLKKGTIVDSTIIAEPRHRGCSPARKRKFTVTADIRARRSGRIQLPITSKAGKSGTGPIEDRLNAKADRSFTGSDQTPGA
jgi:hypothetical protein